MSNGSSDDYPREHSTEAASAFQRTYFCVIGTEYFLYTVFPLLCTRDHHLSVDFCRSLLTGLPAPALTAPLQ